VTILSREAWDAATAMIDGAPDPSARRANILVSGLDLAETRGRVIRLGACEVRVGGETTPCERMDEAAPGLQEALRPSWRGGVFGQVIRGGVLRVGDPAAWVTAALPKVLFVCIENSNRSQMAQAFARIHGAGAVEAFSAGSRPSGKVNPRAIAAMAERGYDLSTHVSRGLDDIPSGGYRAVVTMGCGDECPWIPADLREDWELPDPRDLAPTEFNAVRDEIERRVQALLAQIRATAI
jgi:protein-tyrosine-phosphatase